MFLCSEHLLKSIVNRNITAGPQPLIILQPLSSRKRKIFYPSQKLLKFSWLVFFFNNTPSLPGVHFLAPVPIFTLNQEKKWSKMLSFF